MAYYKCGSVYTTQNSNVVIDTASGPIANFQTPLAMPLLDAQIDVNAVQDLHGQSGAYPPGGSAQIWDEDWELGSIDNSTGLNTNNNNNIRCKNYISVSPSTAYYFKVATSTYIRIYWYDENNTFISSEIAYSGVKTSPDNAKFLRLRTTENYGNTYKNDISVNYPATDTAYHPYSNICPINGWDEISVVRCGKNLFDYNNTIFAYPLASVLETGGGTMRTVFSRCKPNTTYTISKIKSERFIVFWSEKTPAIGINIYGQSSDNTATSLTITTGATAKYICAFVYNANVDTLTPEEILSSIQIEESTSATTYESYTGSTTVIQLNDTYYGGHFTQNKDGHRQLTVTYGVADISELSWNRFNFSGVYCFYVQLPLMKTNYAKGLSSAFEFKSNIYNPNALSNNQFLLDNGNHNGYCYLRCDDYSDVASFKTAMVGQKLIYELATPYTIDLPDGEPIITLNGTNNIYADTGDTSVKFRKIGD